MPLSKVSDLEGRDPVPLADVCRDETHRDGDVATVQRIESDQNRKLECLAYRAVSLTQLRGFLRDGAEGALACGVSSSRTVGIFGGAFTALAFGSACPRGTHQQV